MGLHLKIGSSHNGFVLLETIIAVTLLSAGLISGIGIETLMKNHESRRINEIKQARAMYELDRIKTHQTQLLAG